MQLTNQIINEFQQVVYAHFAQQGRDFPWRHTADPYAILVSEVMLQQTQVGRVIPKYTAWMERFPTLTQLASTSFSEVLQLWSGLGYNRRARYLYDFSQQVIYKYKGSIPHDYRSLLQLPGMGPYTAAAVCVFAFNQPLVLIETNIRTVFIHHFFTTSTTVSDTILRSFVEQTMDRVRPRQWFNALMDYGTYLKATVGNLNVRSSSYSKQSRFQGSLRQVRGAVLKLLLAYPQGLAVTAIIGHLDYSPDLVEDALQGLIKNGLVTTDSKKFWVQESR